MENNFVCPKTGKEYYFAAYTISATNVGMKYKDKLTGKEIVSEDGTPLQPIDRKRGFTTIVYGDTTSRIQNREKFFRERAKKHSNSFDAKDEKIKRTNDEMNNLKNKTNGGL